MWVLLKIVELEVFSRIKRIPSTHALWVVLNHGFSKTLMALKFLLAAKFLGPELMGVVGLLLVIYAIAESLSEFGLIQAIIQAPEAPSVLQINSVWWALFVRGVGLSLLLVGIGYFYPIQSYSEDFIIAAFIIAVCALLKSISSPTLYLAQRERWFSRLFLHSFGGALLDIAITIWCLMSQKGILSVFIGLIASEFIKTVASYFIFSTDRYRFQRLLSPSFNVSSYMMYGKWIWGGNIVNLLLNQSDKLITGSMLGNSALGIYQMGGRLAQLGISDVAVAFGQYLFPSFSRLNNDIEERNNLFFKAFVYMLIFSLSSALTLMIVSQHIPYFLGDDWGESVAILRILAISMMFGALISVLVAYHRASGFPSRVTKASLCQLGVFIPTLYLSISLYGVVGVAISTVISTGVALCLLLRGTDLTLKIINEKLACFYKKIFNFVFILLLALFLDSMWLQLLTCLVAIAQLLHAIYMNERVVT